MKTDKIQFRWSFIVLSSITSDSTPRLNTEVLALFIPIFVEWPIVKRIFFSKDKCSIYGHHMAC